MYIAKYLCTYYTCIANGHFAADDHDDLQQMASNENGMATVIVSIWFPN